MDIKAAHANFLSVTSVAVLAHKAFEAFIELQPEPTQEIQVLLPASICHNAGIGIIPFAAFSVELGLKTLLLDNQVALNRSHDLNDLFKKLPADICERIRNYVCASCGISSPQFDTKLSEERLTFINWRYWHETVAEATVDPGFLLSMAQAIVAEIHAPNA
jgi:hypothetical protein